MLYRRVCEFFVRYRKLDEGVRLKIMCPWANYRGIMFFLGFSSFLHLNGMHGPIYFNNRSVFSYQSICMWALRKLGAPSARGIMGVIPNEY